MDSSTLLLKNAQLLCTMDPAATRPITGAEITDGGVFIRDGIIEQTGKSQELPRIMVRCVERGAGGSCWPLNKRETAIYIYIYIFMSRLQDCLDTNTDTATKHHTNGMHVS